MRGLRPHPCSSSYRGGNTPYSNQADVEFYGQFDSTDFDDKGYDYAAGIQKAITDADRQIDEYCHVPEQFFTVGGIEIQHEYLNGVDIAYIGGIVKFFPWYYGGHSHLTFKHKPVLSVTKFEEETSAGAWTTRTEGASSDYVVVDDGVRFVQNVPAYKYKNVRVTYKAGYLLTPGVVQEASGRLAAAILRNVLDASKQHNPSLPATFTTPKTSLLDDLLSDSIKTRLQNYCQPIYAFG